MNGKLIAAVVVIGGLYFITFKGGKSQAFMKPGGDAPEVTTMPDPDSPLGDVADLEMPNFSASVEQLSAIESQVPWGKIGTIATLSMAMIAFYQLNKGTKVRREA